jgi:hypothetical protein
MLPDAPVEPEVNIPEVPSGLESLVEDLRDQIGSEADTLGDILDFNQFAFDFVCEEICDEIQVSIDAAEAQLDLDTHALSEIIDDLYIVEGNDDESRLEFETRIRD